MHSLNDGVKANWAVPGSFWEKDDGEKVEATRTSGDVLPGGGAHRWKRLQFAGNSWC